MCACLPASREQSIPNTSPHPPHMLNDRSCLPSMADWPYCPWEVNNDCSVPWPGLPTHRKHPAAVVCPKKPCPDHRKCTATMVHAPAHTWEAAHCHRATRPALTALRKCTAAAVCPSKPCLAVGSAPPLWHALASPAINRKNTAHEEQPGQNHTLRKLPDTTGCPRKPCPDTGCALPSPGQAPPYLRKHPTATE